MIPLNASHKFKQGIFKPRNSQKYIGKGICLYRSAWELKFFHWADQNPNVLEWASEAIIIPYISPLDNRVHKYYTDGIVAIRESNNIIAKYIIEIKPSKQTIPPIATKNKKASTLLQENKQYITNNAKWVAARKWCDQRGYKFLIITEKELGIK